jgi:cytochrome c6
MSHLSRIAMLTAVSALVFSALSPANDESPALYKSRCQACHGADGKGETAAGKKLGVRSFQSPEVVKAQDAELIEITTKGKEKMPPYENKLSGDQIKDLIKYIRTLK